MLTIGEYVRAQNLEEAYQLLRTKGRSLVLGGGAWVRLSSRNISRAIDLSQLGLEFIKETAETIEIGAMTTLRQIETNQLLKHSFDGVLPQAVENIVGVQLRNIATLGGTVYSRFGFSDLLTALLVLDCKLSLYEKGVVTLEEFLNLPKPSKDLLEKIIIAKEDLKASFQMLRNSNVDFALLNVAVSLKGNHLKIAVGARPGKAMLAQKAASFANASSITEEIAAEAGVLASEELEFRSNSLASKEYRKEVCKTLVKRALLEVSRCN